MSIPKEGTSDWYQLVANWNNAGPGEKSKIAHDLGYSRTDSVSRALKVSNAVRDDFQPKTIAKVKDEEQTLWTLLQGKINAIPRLTPQLVSSTHNGSEEAQILMLSDFQVGVKTASYDSVVFKNRIQQITQKTVHLGELRRKIHTVKKLHIFFLGDLVHGERLSHQVNIEEFEGPAHWQIIDILVPSMCQMMLTFLNHYDEIRISGIEGNHGWPAGKESAYGTNWDMIAMHLMKAWMGNYPQIKWDIEREGFYKIVEVMGHPFMLTHGDQINMVNTVPFYGVTTKGLRWKNAIAPRQTAVDEMLDAFKADKMSKEKLMSRVLSLPFEYLCMGHFHTLEYITFNGVKIFMNGALSTTDEYALKKMGLASPAEQWTFSVHEKRGVTSMDALYLE